MKTVTIPGNTKAIPEKAYSGDKALEAVVIQDGVTEIGSFAFEYCSSLRHIIVPASVTTFNSQAFFGCTGITSAGPIGSGCSYEFGHKDVIHKQMFMNLKALKRVTIPRGITTIEADAFFGCTSLKEIRIPDSVTTIGKGAFCFCESLESIEIPNSVARIENGTFSRCTSLKKVAIPRSTCIEDGAFNLCERLADEDGFLIVNGTLFKYFGKATEVSVPPRVTRIAHGCFRGENPLCGKSRLKRIVIPDGVTEIGPYAFQDCKSLEEVKLPSTLESIEAHAFDSCASLHEISLPKNVRFIGEDAFKRTPLKNVRVSKHPSEAVTNFLRELEERQVRQEAHYAEILQKLASRKSKDTLSEFWKAHAHELGKRAYDDLVDRIWEMDSLRNDNNDHYSAWFSEGDDYIGYHAEADRFIYHDESSESTLDFRFELSTDKRTNLKWQDTATIDHPRFVAGLPCAGACLLPKEDPVPDGSGRVYDRVSVQKWLIRKPFGMAGNWLFTMCHTYTR